MDDKKYVRALSFKWLTPLYDALVEGPMSAIRLRTDLLGEMGNLDGKRVLDVGCGTGTFSVMIKQKHPAAQVAGLDGDPQILEIARSKARDLDLEIQFDQGMSFDLPYPDRSFDFVLTSMMLHHLSREDKQKTAREMYRVLRPGGRLFGADFAESHGVLGKSIQPITRRFERVADNLDGFLPVIFTQAGFKDFHETRRYILGSISIFKVSKN